MDEPVIIERHERVAILTLNRPAALNALDARLAQALCAAVAAVDADPGIRCVVVTGAGGNFMAGGDVKYFHADLDHLRTLAGGDLQALFAAAHGAIRGIRASGKPFIASAAGAVAGFGLSLYAACDLGLAASDARFSLAYLGIGASPDGGSSWSLPRLIGLRRSLELAFLNERVDAAGAAAMGLVNRVVPAAELAAQTLALATRLAAGPAGAMARTKALMNASLERSLDAQIAVEEAAFAASLRSDDFAEGVAAFCERRPPRFG